MGEGGDWYKVKVALQLPLMITSSLMCVLNSYFRDNLELMKLPKEGLFWRAFLQELGRTSCAMRRIGVCLSCAAVGASILLER